MEHKGSDSAIVEPMCYLRALVVQRQMLVATARYDHNSGARQRRSREIDVEPGFVRVR